MEKSLKEELKRKNLRFTEARQAVYQTLAQSDVAMSPKEVYEELEKTSTDQASVYRNLSLFEELGLVHRFRDGRYTLCTHRHEDDHHHMHIVANCTHCGKYFEIKEHTNEVCRLAKKMASQIQKFKGFSGLTLHGSCSDCSN